MKDTKKNTYTKLFFFITFVFFCTRFLSSLSFIFFFVFAMRVDASISFFDGFVLSATCWYFAERRPNSWHSFFVFFISTLPRRWYHLLFKTHLIVEIAFAAALVFIALCFSFCLFAPGGDFFFVFFLSENIIVLSFYAFSCVLCGCRTSLSRPGLISHWSRRSRRIKATQVWQRRHATPWAIWPVATPPIR